VRPLRVQVADVARRLHAAGWVANHDGNVTARDGARFLATPTATSKRLVGDRDLIEVDARGVVRGPGKVFGEIGLHLAIYERRPDVGCVVHAHPPHATAISASRGNPIERPFIAEAVVSLGPRIPKLPYAQPGDAARAALAPWCELVDAVLLGNHGVIAWGADPEQAVLRLELVEHLARIAIAAAPLGGIEPLPEAAIAPLLAARAKANLGRAADRAVATAAELSVALSSASASFTSGTPGAPRAVVACAPAPHSPVPTIDPTPHDARSLVDPGRRAAGTTELAAVIREEIARALAPR
jgi:L-fuculose-phosphate aldolase